MADNVTTQTASLATIPTSTVIETRDQGSGVERQIVQTCTGFRVSSNFTRPADTTAYSVGDLIANNTTAASVVPLSFVCGNASAVTATKSTYHITGAKLKKSTTASPATTFNLYLFATDPSAASGIANGDNATFSVADAGFLTQLQIAGLALNAVSPFSDCSQGTLRVADPAIIVTSSNSTIYGLLAATGAYTPGSSEVFTITLEGYVD